MLKINFHKADLEKLFEKYKTEIAGIKTNPTPPFESTAADLGYIAKSAAKYKKYKNVILIANGGSRTSAWAFYYSLFDFRNKVKFEFVTSPEARIIRRIRRKYSKKDTLVMVISKSGSNINNLEPLMLLSDYPVLIITGEQPSTLREMAQRKKWEIIIHPEVEGRFSGMTASGLVPAQLMGLGIKNIYQGAKKGYASYGIKSDFLKNNALKMALYFHYLEQNGYGEIFTSIYSYSLFGFLPLIVQLIHETYGKDNVGQTVFGDYSPESQHHTNQRFLGGPKNVIGMFLEEEKVVQDIKLNVPKAFESIYYKDQPLKILEKNTSGECMRFDLRGVLENALEHNIPTVKIGVQKITPESVGELMVFFHYFVVYCAYLRKVNPFDQPEVEAAKKISFALRFSK